MKRSIKCFTDYMKHKFSHADKLGLILLGLILFVSCSTESDNLTGVIEDAWDEIEDDIEKSASNTLEDLTDNPEKLYNKGCEADYSSFGDIFTLRIPIDYSSKAAVGLLFGSDAAEFISLVENTKRNTQSKSDIKKLILKHFNPSWAGMMTALIVLDGEFNYDFENESWFDASFDFDAKALYKILNDKGYFNGGYGDRLPLSTSETDDVEVVVTEVPSPATNMGFKNGYNEFSGNMIHTNGRKFSFGLSFDYNSSTGEFNNILYTNKGSGTKLNLSAQMIDTNKVKMEGKDGGKALILIFEGQGPYNGDAWWGDFHQDVELY